MMRPIVATVAILAVVTAACAEQRRPSPGADAGEGQPGTQTVEVIATEYSFDIPASVSGGQTTFVLQNQGQERHFMEMVRLKGGRTVEELLQLPGNKADRFIEEVGGTRPVKPGGSTDMEANLAPGEYGIVCFIEAPDGQPHASKGMYAQFEVA